MTVTTDLDVDLMKNLARTIRGLSIDGVEVAKSGHPGMPLGCADIAAVLWYYHMRYNPVNPQWPNRDRFVLSAGHGSMLIYSLLHLTGHDLPLEELKNFRQLHSKTPGHPENFMTSGVETTTGPLGQGFGNGVGMALSTHMMKARFPELIDHNIFGIISDGDLMEGVAAEAASFAGHHKLGCLNFVYDDNNISIEGHTDITFTGEDVAKRFEAYGWHVQKCDGHNVEEIHECLNKAKAVTDKPSIICAKTTIGFGSPNKANTAGVHGSPLGGDEIKLTKEKLGLDPEQTFVVPQDDIDAWKKVAQKGAALEAEWQAKLESSPADVKAKFQAHLDQKPGDLESKRPSFEDGKAVATRKSAGAAQNAFVADLEYIVGGSADLSPSTNTTINDSASITGDDFSGRNIHFGVREHGMGSIMNGMVLHGFFRPFGSTFLVFSDYMRPTIRLAALMNVPAIYVFTHDSIFLGEDGPTHQPVEHLAALRAIPNVTVIRPGDAYEASKAWEVTLESKDGPICLVLSRQNLPTLARGEEFACAEGLRKGGYVIYESKGGDADLILIATGSELPLAVDSAKELESKGKKVRVVSMPCVELFNKQDATYKESVLPKSNRKRLVIEAGIKQGWESIATEDGGFVTQDGFGASAPAGDLAKEFGFTVENVVAKALEL